MRKLSFAAALLLLLCLVLSPFQAQAAEMKVFRIDSAEDLLTLAESCRLDSYSIGLLVTLTNDIDLSGIAFSGIPSFSGSFDGGSHTISGLSVSGEGSVQGLFRYVTEGALVEDLHVQGTITPTGSAAIIGGIAGHNAGVLSGCSFSGIVSGVETVGGIAGINALTGIIQECTTGGTVHGAHFVGGLAGQNSGVIRNCKNAADVNTTLEQNQINLEDITLDAITGTETAAAVTDIGGVCGASSGVIRKCVNTGNIGYPKVGYNIGGIVGSNSGYVADCTNAGVVQGRKDVGGIAGQLEPAVSMLFEEDALQTLEGQMQTMSGIADATASHVQGAANDLKTQIDALDREIGNVQGALDALLPDSNNPQPPDADTIQAAKNVLSGSMTAISGILNSAGSRAESSVNIISQDLNALSGQMSAISQTLSTAKENLGGSIQDVSDADTDADTTAKLYSCKNTASVSGDWNVGGIAGVVGLESDLDPESDLVLTGNLSASFDLSFRAVIRSCDNRGAVAGSKQYIGGIAGRASMGLLKDCVTGSAVDAPAAEYVGGIAGQSSSYIRGCMARCSVTAESYAGGIAGSGVTVTDCYSLVLLSGGEKTGAILGDAEDRSAIENNYYLCVGSDPGAIDGISYALHAYGLDAESFFALDGIPADFDHVHVSFRFEDGTTKTIILPYGFTLNPSHIPELPAKTGYESTWEGSATLTDPMYFDTSFTAVYTAHITVLPSDLLSPEGHPRMLAQGDFLQGQALTLTIAEDAEALSAWTVSLPESSMSMTFRLLPPDAASGQAVILQLQRNGEWEDVSYTTDGSYLVFTPEGDFQALRLLPAPNDYSMYILAGVAVLFICAAITVILCIRAKKKKTA